MASEKSIENRLFYQLGKEGTQLVLVDAGARGGAPEPWSMLPVAHYRSHGFEPDPEAYEALKESIPEHHTTHPFALWEGETEIQLHLNKSRATSSVYPPNFEVLADFPARNTDSRQVEKVIQVPAKALDQLIDEPFVDQLKIDVHSAEFEVLKGAEQMLKKTGCVMVETWAVAVHEGQKLLGDVLQFLDRNGFAPYHFNNAYMAWDERSTGIPKGVSRRRQVASVVLFFRKDMGSIPSEYRLRAAALADIYGYPETALRLLGEDEFAKQKLAILEYWNQFEPAKGGIKGKLFPNPQPYIAPVE